LLFPDSQRQSPTLMRHLALETNPGICSDTEDPRLPTLAYPVTTHYCRSSPEVAKGYDILRMMVSMGSVRTVGIEHPCRRSFLAGSNHDAGIGLRGTLLPTLIGSNVRPKDDSIAVYWLCTSSLKQLENSCVMGGVVMKISAWCPYQLGLHAICDILI